MAYLITKKQVKGVEYGLECAFLERDIFERLLQRSLLLFLLNLLYFFIRNSSIFSDVKAFKTVMPANMRA